MLLALAACQAPPVPAYDYLHVLPYDAPEDDTRVVEASVVDTGTVDTAPAFVEDPPPTLLLNEVMPKNRSTLQVDGAFPDWVEIYDADTVPVDLHRVTLTDGSGRVWLGPEGVTLLPGERYVVYADRTTGGAHAPFSLDSDGDTLTLAYAGAVTDRMSVGALDADVAWARHPDGGDWAPTIDTTPDAANPDAPSDTLDLTDSVFQTETLHTVDISLSADAIQSLRDSRLSWVEGGVTVDGITYDSVGVRLKAYVGSSRTIDQKCGFKVDLDRYADQEWRGLEGLTLNNMVQDYTYVHEYLAYTLFRAVGVPAPRVGYARVSVNGEDYGLYLVVESIDDRFLDRWYADSSGALYEGAYGVDLSSGSENSFDYDEGPDSTDRSDLTAVIDVLDGTADDDGIAALEALVDEDEVLTNMAVEAVILHWDGYTTRNNYRLYHDPTTDRFQIIPWGTDQTFTTVYCGPWSGYGYLFTFCLENQACADRYDARLLEVIDAMEALPLADMADELHTWLLPEINTDPRREFGMSTHTAYYDATLSNIASYPETVRAQVEAR